MSSLTVFAVHSDGSTEVIAHIESTTAEATDTVVDDNIISVTYDETDISTGYIISGCVIIAFLLLVISLVVIYLCRKKTISTGSVNGSVENNMLNS